MSLVNLVNNSKTDKNTLHSYLELYENLLCDKKRSAKNILEIGIGDFGEKNGGSIKLWVDYFCNAKIYAADILPISKVMDDLIDHDRVVLYTSTDAYDITFFENEFLNKNIRFDFMLDDGPHTLESMCKFIQLYLQLLEDDGILIIEDVQSMDWIDILKKEVPNELKQFIKVYDLRHKKNRYDDIVFTVDKRIGKNKIYPSIEFSFGIITDGNNDVFLTQMIDSIVSQQIPSYEIIIVGNTSLQYQTYESIPIKFINFDETIKPGWITRKKNICCNESQYENIVLLHDHIILEPGWYDGFCKYGNNFDICVTKIKTVDGNRFRDYILFAPWCSPHFETGALLPYDFTMTVPVNKLTYISGSYYIVKRGIALKYPLNEGLSWDQTEDLVFCRELSKNNILMLCNSNSSVTCLKNKWQPHWEKPITDEGLKYLNVINSFYCHLQS